MCKTFENHGSESAGVMSPFAAYLDNKVHLTKFKGNRFNVIFYNAAAAYYYMDSFRSFLEVWGSGNLLLEAVKKDLESPVYVAGIRALGIIDKIITGPLWRLINSEGNIGAVLSYLDVMEEKLKVWSSDASELVAGRVVMFDEGVAEVHRDGMYETMFTDTDDIQHNIYTQEALEIILTHFQLSLHRCTHEMRTRMKSDRGYRDAAAKVPATNVASERDFGQLDMLMRQRPNARTINMEATILYANNKTADWLDTLDIHHKERYINTAISSVKYVEERYKQRKLAIYKHKREQLEAKKIAKQLRDENKRQEKRQIIEKLHELGGEWKTGEDIIQKLDQIKTKTGQKLALGIQLRYHKIVLCNDAPRNLFMQQHQGKTLTVAQLTDNLVKIISEYSSDTQVPSTSEIINAHKPEASIRKQDLHEAKQTILRQLQTQMTK
ncbi:PREDICTED: uncharacterized protein LOC106816789, partial [Priapulus caudatus]|uniref:Uncharacterized protein LOC106816789 n=1 Tax=Priapulus caudatus TaxID=37621 RepID=A0ABM1EXH6_PRICU